MYIAVIADSRALVAVLGRFLSLLRLLSVVSCVFCSDCEDSGDGRPTKITISVPETGT